MKKIVITKDFVFLYLHKDFYDENLILKTLPIYSDFFEAKVKSLGSYNILTIKSKDAEFSNELLANEFANYLIGEMCNR